MSYATSLVARLKDADEGWPRFERGDFLAVLDDLAEQVFAKDSVEGHLAALLIWHQLCEEWATLLLKDAQFFIQLSVYPAEIGFPEKKKPMMFGQVLDDLSKTISFARKEEFLVACHKLNAQRTKLVHQLTRHTSLADIMARVVEAKSIYDHVFKIFEDAHDDFRVNFHSFAKNSIEFMEEEITENQKS